MGAGIPEATKRLTLKFRYNDLNSLRQLFAEHPQSIAAVMLEAEKDREPMKGFLPGLKELCAREGAVFILDEMITGFRWANGGAQGFHGVTADLSAFGKALGNGFAISALVGRRELMERGGLRHAGERVFLLSTTHGAETPALAAALETMRIYQREPVVETLWRQGRRLADGINQAAQELGLQDYFLVKGRPCCLMYSTCGPDKQPSQAFRTLFLQETMKQGLLLPSLVVSYSHSDADIQRTVEGIAAALGVYRRALDEGIERHLQGRPVKPVFRKSN
jgi:glutamate-1-semialdehyde 2,1-aminomutase